MKEIDEFIQQGAKEVLQRATDKDLKIMGAIYTFNKLLLDYSELCHSHVKKDKDTTLKLMTGGIATLLVHSLGDDFDSMYGIIKSVREQIINIEDKFNKQQ